MALYKATITGCYPGLVWYVEASNIADAALKFRIKLANMKDTRPLRIESIEEMELVGKAHRDMFNAELKITEIENPGGKGGS